MAAASGSVGVHSASPPEIQGIEIRLNTPVGKFTSFGVDCRAHALVVANSMEGLREFVRWALARNENFYVLGGGTNCIFTNPFYDGYIIKLGQAFRDVKLQGELIRAGCSIPLSRLLNIAISENLTGLEFCWDIPGTLGGAVAGNAGSAGEALCPLIEAVKGIDETGAVFVARRGGFEYRYRGCALRGKILTEIIVKLQKEQPEVIQERLQRYKDARWIQPIGVKSSGCIFKNPDPEHPAGRLIDEAGLKGYQFGGAMISGDHANFFINKKKASAEDVLGLVQYVQQAVYEKHGFWLEPEVQFINSSDPQ